MLTLHLTHGDSAAKALARSGLSRSERQLCETRSPARITLGRLFVVHTNGSQVIAPLRDTGGRAFWERPCS